MEIKAKINFKCKYIELLEDLKVLDFVIPKGFKTDGATIPRIFWSFVGSPLTGKYVKSAILHDYLYSKECKYDVPIDQANYIFLKSMLDEDVSNIKAYTMYIVVEMFGSLYYKKEKQWCKK